MPQKEASSTHLRDWLRSGRCGRSWRLDAVWLSEVGRLLPELFVQRPDLPRPEPLAEQWQRRLFEALAQAFAAVKAPLLLVLDDLQWCDRETLEWLHYLLRFNPKACLLVAGTVRPEEVDPQHALTTLLLNLRSTGQLAEIELGPLDVCDTAVLASQVAERNWMPKRQSSLPCHRRQSFVHCGNRRASFGGLGPKQDNRSSPNHFHALPPKVQAVIQSRLAQLSLRRAILPISPPPSTRIYRRPMACAGELNEGALVRGWTSCGSGACANRAPTPMISVMTRFVKRPTATSAWCAGVCCIAGSRRRWACACGDLDTVSGQIAMHYESAGLLEKALVYQQRAAEVAQQIYAHRGDPLS